MSNKLQEIINKQQEQQSPTMDLVDDVVQLVGFEVGDEEYSVPILSIQEIIKPDAVLYMTVVEWGVKYHVIESVTVVHVRGRLVSVNTGTVLWKGEHTVRKSSSSGQNDIIGMLASAVINQIVSSLSGPSRDVARATNTQLFFNQEHGLLLGPRHNEFEMDQREHRALQNQTISESSGP